MLRRYVSVSFINVSAHDLGKFGTVMETEGFHIFYMGRAVVIVFLWMIHTPKVL